MELVERNFIFPRLKYVFSRFGRPIANSWMYQNKTQEQVPNTCGLCKLHKITGFLYLDG